jgi:hypothetical protein
MKISKNKVAVLLGFFFFYCVGTGIYRFWRDSSQETVTAEALLKRRPNFGKFIVTNAKLNLVDGIWFDTSRKSRWGNETGANETEPQDDVFVPLYSANQPQIGDMQILLHTKKMEWLEEVKVLDQMGQHSAFSLQKRAEYIQQNKANLEFTTMVKGMARHADTVLSPTQISQMVHSGVKLSPNALVLEHIE